MMYFYKMMQNLCNVNFYFYFLLWASLLSLVPKIFFSKLKMPKILKRINKSKKIKMLSSSPLGRISEKIPILFILYTFLVTSPLGAVLMYYWERQYPATSTLSLGQKTREKYALVLSGGTLEYNYQLSRYQTYDSIARFLEAINLYNQKSVEKIILSGISPLPRPSHLLSETLSMEKWALDNNINPQDLIIEHMARTTYEEALEIKKMIHLEAEDSIILITSAYHMARSMALFKKQNIKVLAYPVDFKIYSKESFLRWGSQNIYYLNLFLHETVGMIYYKLKQYI